MPTTDCITCDHSAVLHNQDGTCSVPGCACDQLVTPEFAPNVDPPKPGCCLHIMGGAVWLIEDVEEVDTTLDAGSGFCKFTACDFEDAHGKKVYVTYPLRVRPETVGSFHGFPQERWNTVLEAIR